MKYERLTQWVGDGASLILDNPRNVEEAKEQLQDKFKLACIKLATLEDKIERGELVEVQKEVVVYTPNVVLTPEERGEEMRLCNEERKQVVKDVLLTMLDRMDRLTGCGVPYHVKKFINEIAAENGIELERKEDEE